MTKRERERNGQWPWAWALLAATPAFALGAGVAPPEAPSHIERLESAVKLQPDLVEALGIAEADDLLQITIVMKDQASRDRVAQIRAMGDKDAQRDAMRDLLKPIAANSQRELLDLLRQEQAAGRVGEHIRSLWIANVIGLKATPEVIRRVARRDDVAYVNYDQPVGKEIFPVGPWEDQEFPSEIECGVDLMGAPQVWDELGITGAGTVVGVIDTGCCLTHPDLANQVWVNVDEVANNNIDDDGNGFVDDVNGWNFENNNKDVTDFWGHGTHVTGTVVGDGAQGTQTGMAHNAQFMTIKFWNSFSGEQTVWDGMQYGVDNDADVLTASLGWPHSMNPDRVVWRTVCENAIAAGVLVTYAAGNEGSCCGIDSVRTPGDVPDVITVGATDCNDNIAWFSSTGPVTWEDIPPYNDWPHPPGKIKPTIAAPGVQTKSTSSACSGYLFLDGTSMATPHIAGTLALMLEANPDLQQLDAIEILQGTALDLGSEGEDNTFGAGRVDAYEAVVASMDGELPLRLDASNIVAGVRCQVEAFRCTPGASVAFLYSTAGLGSTFIPQLNVTVDLDSPHLIGVDTADGTGYATLIQHVPNAAQGRHLWMQAAEQGRTSNVIERDVQ